MLAQFQLLLLASAPLLPLALAQDPAEQQSPGIAGPVLNVSHADPCVFRTANGTWYSFADGQAVIQSTTTDIRGPWKSLPNFELNFPNGKWIHGDNIGAPQVNQLADGSYILFFSAGPNNTVSDGDHKVGDCIGVARSSSLLGPYAADALPYNCTTSGNGTGPSAPAFFQQGGKNYVLYKSGYGWDPSGVTKILIKEVAADGTTDIGEPVLIAEHNRGQYFEIEGPQMSYNDGVYYAFYNLGVWCDSSYHIVWSSSKDPLGTYTYGGTLLESGTTQNITLVAPGGAGFTTGDPNTMTFMAYVDYPDPQCHDSQEEKIGSYRQLYTAQINYVNGIPTLATSSN